MRIDAEGMHFKTLNAQVRAAGKTVVIDNCCGQRYIAAGQADQHVTVNGTPGNALGAYLDGAVIEVNGNAQDATGDTMNDGLIIIRGSSGDATGYAMRGGRIFVAGDAGYRAGIHMKAYQKKVPALVVGGRAGSFLGEYQAGGIILVLGLGHDAACPPVGRFCGTGMHGGKIVLRSKRIPEKLPAQVSAHFAGARDLKEIQPLIASFCACTGQDPAAIEEGPFVILTPNFKNPYRRLYTEN